MECLVSFLFKIANKTFSFIEILDLYILNKVYWTELLNLFFMWAIRKLGVVFIDLYHSGFEFTRKISGYLSFSTSGDSSASTDKVYQ